MKRIDPPYLRKCHTCPATSRKPFADGWCTGSDTNDKIIWECMACADARNAKQTDRQE